MQKSELPKQELLDDAFYTVNDICEVTGLSRYTIYACINDGSFGPTQLRGKGKHLIKGSAFKRLMVSKHQSNGIS